MRPAVETIAPPDDFEPMRVGEHAALDFLNSIVAPSTEVVDFLHDGASLVRWLTNGGVLPETVASAVRDFTPRQRDHLAAEARELREWLRPLVLRWVAGGDRAVHAADLGHLNALMAKSPMTRVLVRGWEGIELRTHQCFAEPYAVIAELAAVCADLFAHHQHDKVRKCENPNCTMLFTDYKRGPQRRWCSMAICGNRMKVAAHRARRRLPD